MTEQLLSAAKLREIAEREVNDRQIDRDVRDAARSGSPDAAGINYHRDIDTGSGIVSVYATFGAGTNSARVLDNKRGITVYEAHGYGKHLVTFRDGRWHEYVRIAAMGHRDREAATKLLGEVESERSAAEQFTPLDDIND